MVLGLIIGAVGGGLVVALVPKLYVWIKAKATAAEAAVKAKL